ncbi:MAG: hypothetical protein LQ338_006839 [Usnochroma carphineum]|nr:MAG: hypothetical protein LQ338_006839 [Usnochroma carphineum]
MGWFTRTPSPSPSPSTPKPTSDGAFIAPDRSARDRCYEARDAFFACLDRANIVDSIKEADKAEQECGGLEKGMGRECAASWVKYFKQRRVMEWKKQKTYERLAVEGAEGMPEGLAIPSATASYHVYIGSKELEFWGNWERNNLHELAYVWYDVYFGQALGIKKFSVRYTHQIVTAKTENKQLLD